MSYRKDGSVVIRITAEAARFIDEMSGKSRRGKSRIASDAILFAAKHVKLVPAECYDIVFEDDDSDRDGGK